MKVSKIGILAIKGQIGSKPAIVGRQMVKKGQRIVNVVCELPLKRSCSPNNFSITTCTSGFSDLPPALISKNCAPMCFEHPIKCYFSKFSSSPMELRNKYYVQAELIKLL
jgi:hypothetical protein